MPGLHAWVVWLIRWSWVSERTWTRGQSRHEVPSATGDLRQRLQVWDRWGVVVPLFLFVLKTSCLRALCTGTQIHLRPNPSTTTPPPPNVGRAVAGVQSAMTLQVKPMYHDGAWARGGKSLIFVCSVD